MNNPKHPYTVSDIRFITKNIYAYMCLYRFMYTYIQGVPQPVFKMKPRMLNAILINFFLFH